METDAQPTKSESKGHRLPCHPHLLVGLAIVPIFYFINKLFLAFYFGRASQRYADLEPQINPWLILLELSLLVLLLRLSKRSWFQFSLRTLMIFVTLFAVACSWFAVKMQQARRQREAVEAIVKLGGKVMYDYQSREQNEPVVAIVKSGGQVMYDYQFYEYEIQSARPPGPAWLRNILGDDFFCTVVDAQPKDDASMPILKDLSGIRTLNLRYSQVTDAGLEYLKGLPQLKLLLLSGTQVTDAGLEHLKGLTQLQRLELNANITDTGLEHLKGLPQLKYLQLIDTKVTDEGVKKFRQALPNCHISPSNTL
jgi:hypothetical protein